MNPWRLIVLMCVAILPELAQAVVGVDAARLWPSPDYTRLTLEAKRPIPFKYFILQDPDRLVLDLAGVEIDSNLNALAGLVQPDDVCVKAVRAGSNRPGVTRLVLELKAPVRPSIFAIKPLGNYGYRLVVDLYPQSAGGNSAPLHVSPDQSVPADSVNTRSARDAAVAKPSRYARLLTIAIDAGHGGEDPGAKGANGTYEKQVTLAVARKLKDKIDQQENMRAVLTRDGDYFIPLQDRVTKARNMRADLFVSIHADSFARSGARGTSVFALSEHGATSAAARWLAKKENDADLIGGINIDVKDPNLKRTLIDLSQTATINDSLELGRSVLHQLGEINELHTGRVEQAGFAVLKAPDIPSILVETAFISNPDEEKRLTDEAYQNKLADAIVDGIKAYFAKNPPAVRIRLTKDM
ncbi:MAG TPA: N-acetylmuramoyl-L-alanine amidase [Thiobacillaceae bacterium]|nr:N-acetylmuramoyl-L-alanine amidase [Thiobacillaceae bacterium]